MILRRRLRERNGTAAVELALVLPLFLTLLLGVLEFARLGMVMQVLTTAAREGCREAALPGFTFDAGPGARQCRALRLGHPDVYDGTHPLRPDHRGRRVAGHARPQPPLLEGELARDFNVHERHSSCFRFFHERESVAGENPRSPFRCDRDQINALLASDPARSSC